MCRRLKPALTIRSWPSQDSAALRPGLTAKPSLRDSVAAVQCSICRNSRLIPRCGEQQIPRRPEGLLVMTKWIWIRRSRMLPQWIVQAGYAPEGALLPSASIRIDQQLMPCSAVLASTDEQQVLRLRVRPTRQGASRKGKADAPLRMTKRSLELGDGCVAG
jgi:hypothetical protein